MSGYVEVFWSFHAPVYGTILPQSGRKFTYAVVLKSGATSLSLEEIDAQIRECLIDGMYFTAEKVGLPTLYFDERNDQLDHEWHEYDRVREESENTTEAASVDIVEFLRKLKL